MNGLNELTSIREIEFVLVEDHPIVADHLLSIINSQENWNVSGCFENATEACAFVLAKKPAMVLANVSLKNSNGLELIQYLRKAKSPSKILLFSGQPEEIYARRVLDLGAQGYLPKSAKTKDILVAVKQVLAGEMYLSSNTKKDVLLDGLSRLTTSQGDLGLGLLTNRELEVFGLVGQGFSQVEIAEKLGLSASTIATHRTRIKQKCKVENGRQLLRIAARWFEGYA